MAIARKGTRPITVDGTTYRWRVNGDDVGWGHVTVTVALDERPGRIMQFQASGETMASANGYPHPVVGPSKVAEAIRLAVRHGWRADEPGEPLRLWHVLPGGRQASLRASDTRNTA